MGVSSQYVDTDCFDADFETDRPFDKLSSSLSEASESMTG